jgi:adenylate kinase
MNIIVLGPPGVGKGTQADMLAEKLGIPQISTGEIFRENIEKRTGLGKKAKAFIDKGELVPDEITISIIEKRLADCKKGFILDGFPRDIHQAEALDKITKIDLVIDFAAPDAVVVDRIAGRMTCHKCQAIYNIRTAPHPKKPGVCDKCKGALYQRDDQKEEVVKHRLEVYTELTSKLIDYYKKKMIKVDATASIEKIHNEVMKKIQKFKGEK